jgi:hypothetical protein
MLIALDLRFDSAGSETLKYNHYTFGKRGSAISGGCYVL